MIGGVLRVLVTALVAAPVLVACGRDEAPATTVATTLDAPRELPPVALVDKNGEPFTIGELAGKPVLVFFGFTHCPDICPLTLAVLAEAMRSLRTEELAPAVLFVSVDPERDTPPLIKDYVETFDADFGGATADEAMLAPLTAALGVTVHKMSDGDQEYSVMHNGTVYVLDAAGRWVAIFGGSAHRAEDIVGDYRALRERLSGE